MKESNNGKAVIIFIIISAICLIIGAKYTLFTDTTPKESDTKIQGYKTNKPALTLKEDKANAEAQEQKNDSSSDKDKSKDKDKKQENQSKKSMKDSAKKNALKTLQILDKPKDEYKNESTQSLFKSVATKEFVDNHNSNNKDNKVVTYKNVSIDIRDKDLDKSKAKGSLKFDRLTKPKSKKSSVKPSTELDYKIEFTFKKEDNSFKVDGIQS